MARCGRILMAVGMASVLVLTFAAAEAGTWQARAAAAGPAVTRAWMNSAQSPERRAEELVAQMTLAEKITELHGIQDSQHRRYVPGIPRLGIPPLVITNGPAGVGPGDDPQQQPATALPAPVSLAASFDIHLAYQCVITGSAARDLGNSLVEGPTSTSPACRRTAGRSRDTAKIPT